MSSKLRTQFLDYMTLHRFSRHTKKNYLLAVKVLQAISKKILIGFV